MASEEQSSPQVENVCSIGGEGVAGVGDSDTTAVAGGDVDVVEVGAGGDDALDEGEGGVVRKRPEVGTRRISQPKMGPLSETAKKWLLGIPAVIAGVFAGRCLAEIKSNSANTVRRDAAGSKDGI
ncbi:hypothetical protein TEA_021305 [Camellia sinensis var. sinensis]|uniref:Uncharacterized protein n=1 Tax=Camellia sinensis var. sinensis TaxID=542762 RepID=A0A4S4DYG2_CAMSN|nr:hypothetical protein TEA_021305 [Camellia sinensis var. sinensis]